MSEKNSAAATRESILDRAEELTFEHGFAATSIDLILKGIGLTKGAFFYHFKSKAELGRALVERYAERDAETLMTVLRGAEERYRDPLQQLLAFVQTFIDQAEQLTDAPKGCLFASYIYESTQFDEETRNVVARSYMEWRTRIGDKLRLAMQQYALRIPVNPDSLADYLTTTFEGAFILSKTLRDPGILGEHLRHYRTYLETLFIPREIMLNKSTTNKVAGGKDVYHS